MKMKKKYWFNINWIVVGGFYTLFLVTCVLLFFTGGNQRLAIPLLMLKVIGFIASFVLILGQLGHPLFDRFCLKGEKLNCHAVLESPAGKLLGLIPMADLGAVYFFGGVILICFSVFDIFFFHRIYLLAALNLLTLPYTIFSVLYQALVVKRWCYLCLIVQLIFWLEFSQFYQYLSAGFPRFTLEHFFIFIWSFALPALAWMFFRPLIRKMITSEKGD
jgi:uncharacterized membrane protein